MRRVAACVLSGAAALSSCKAVNQQTSTAKSLDNFASSTARPVLNTCGFPPADARPATAFLAAYAGSVDVTDGGGITVADVANTLNGVPGFLLAEFFDPAQAGGRIKITKTTPQLCQNDLDPTLKAFDTEGSTDPIMSCRFVDSQRPVIYVDANPQALGHALVRAVGLAIAEDLSHAHLANGKRDLTMIDPAFVADAVSLATPFLDQIKTTGDDGTKAKMAKLLGVADLSQSADALAAIMGGAGGDAQTFLNILYAEAFDSYYCSPATRTAARSGFQPVFTAFAKIHQQVMSSLQLPTLNKLKKVPADGSPRGKQASNTASVLALFNGPPDTANDVPGTAQLALDGYYYYYPQTVTYYYPQTYAATDYGYQNAYYTPQTYSSYYSYDPNAGYYSGYQPGFFNSIGRGAVAAGRFLTFRWGRLADCGGQWNC